MSEDLLRASARRHGMVVHAYYPPGEPRVQREAEALVDAGYSVDVICLRDRGERPRERYRGVDIHRLPVRRDKSSLGRQFRSYLHFLARAAVQLSKLEVGHRYHSVQVHNLPDFLVFCALLPRLQGVPIILDLHDLMPEFFAGRFGEDRRRWLGRMVRWQERLACRFAHHVITVSEHWRQALVRRGVPEEKCSVVMNVADDRIFRPRGASRSSGQEFRLIYHGTVTHRYGLDLAMRAVGTLKEEMPDIRLTVLGRGDAMPSLVRLRRELGLEDQVELRDEYVMAEGLPEILAEADLGIVPSRDDTFTDALVPTKLMEYGAMGIPCVAARTTAIEAYFRDTMVEFFRPGDVGELARCIRDLRQSPQRLAALADGSRAFRQRYSWDRVAREYVGLVAGLSERGPLLRLNG